MKLVFLDAATMGDDLSLDIFSQFGQFTVYQTTSKTEIPERVAQANVVLLNKVKFRQEEIDAAPNLKLICVAATGTDNVDKQYAASKGIAVRNVAGYSTDSVAQTAFTHILALTGKLVYFNQYIHQGSYITSPQPTHYGGRYFHNLAGQRIGIIGMGAIGRKVAQIASAFGMEVVYYSTTGKNTDQPYPCLSLEDLLKTSDVVSIHAPLTPATEYLINASNLKLMKPTAILINMGRGRIVNEQDLVDALNKGLIAGAGIDVFSTEPTPQNHPFYQLHDPEKMILTPHIAWASIEARKRLVKMMAQNIIDEFRLNK